MKTSADGGAAEVVDARAFPICCGIGMLRNIGTLSTYALVDRLFPASVSRGRGS
jgi:hypothetical protein